MKAALVGLGTMGPGIAAVLSRAGIVTKAYDLSPSQRAEAPKAIATARVILERLGAAAAADIEAEVVDTLEDCVADADLVIENVPERLELKRDVIAAIADLVPATCIIASDTSGIPITKLQDGMPAPGRIVGMHWSNPPHLIPMIEVIAGAQTEPETTARVTTLIRNLGLIPIQVRKDVPGFVENRILYSVMREAVDLVEQGVISPEDMDSCVQWGIGYKLAIVGPMALLDMAGLDIYQSVGSYLNADLCARADVSPMIAEITARGRLGLKTGSGLFDYTPEQIAELRRSRVEKFIAVRRSLEDNGA